MKHKLTIVYSIKCTDVRKNGVCHHVMQYAAPLLCERFNEENISIRIVRHFVIPPTYIQATLALPAGLPYLSFQPQVYIFNGC